MLWRVIIHILMQYMHTIEGKRAVQKYSINEFKVNLLLSFIDDLLLFIDFKW